MQAVVWSLVSGGNLPDSMPAIAVTGFQVLPGS